jgi:hypothetical protein
MRTAGWMTKRMREKMSSYAASLEILEVAYDVSPGGVRTFEIYDKSEMDPVQIPLFETESLTEAVEYCYNLGKDFTVRTYAEWEMREMLADI